MGISDKRVEGIYETLDGSDVTQTLKDFGANIDRGTDKNWIYANGAIFSHPNPPNSNYFLDRVATNKLRFVCYWEGVKIT